MHPSSVEIGKFRPLVAFLIFAAMVVFAYVGWFGWYLKLTPSQSPEPWGQFGDYVGGVLNPLISGAALIWLIRSVHIQTTELEDTRHALADAKKSQAEQMRLAGIKTERETLNLRLSAVIYELGHHRSTMNVWLATANTKQREPIVIDEDNNKVKIEDAIEATRTHLLKLAAEKASLLQALDALQLVTSQISS